MKYSWCSLSSAEDVKFRRAGRAAHRNRQAGKKPREEGWWWFVVVVVLQAEPPFPLFPDQHSSHQLPVVSLLVVDLVGRP